MKYIKYDNSFIITYFLYSAVISIVSDRSDWMAGIVVAVLVSWFYKFLFVEILNDKDNNGGCK